MTERITRTNGLKAAYAGGEANRAGEPVTACPHSLTGSVTEEFLARAWIKGWRAADTA